ncbi:MAG: hypothetical protein ACPLYF_02360 [Fervidobacterium sp.]
MRKLLAVLLLLPLVFPLVYAAEVSVQAQVQKYITVTFSYSAVNFGTLNAGTTDNPAPNQLNGVYNVSVDTNYAYDVKASGTDFSDGAGHTFAVSNLKMDTNSTASNLAVGSAIALSGTQQTIDSYAYTVTNNFHGFWLSIPAGQYAASYSSTVTISYSNQ